MKVKFALAISLLLGLALAIPAISQSGSDPVASPLAV